MNIFFFVPPRKKKKHLFFAVSLSPHARSCHSPSEKGAKFYTFNNRVLNISLDSISFNNEIQNLKAIALDRGYIPSIEFFLNYKILLSHILIIIK